MNALVNALVNVLVNALVNTLEEPEQFVLDKMSLLRYIETIIEYEFAIL